MFTIGCSSGHDLVQIEGTVTIDGKPLEQGTILFEVSGARTAFGEVKNGQILSMTTFDPGDGVPIGEAKVAVNSLDESSPTQAQADVSANAPGGPSGMTVGRSLIPKTYSNPATSGLTISVAKGMEPIDLQLSSKP